jgi:hypothetical protein
MNSPVDARQPLQPSIPLGENGKSWQYPFTPAVDVSQFDNEGRLGHAELAENVGSPGPEHDRFSTQDEAVEHLVRQR